MPFLLPNQQCKNTKGYSSSNEMMKMNVCNYANARNRWFFDGTSTAEFMYFLVPQYRKCCHSITWYHLTTTKAAT